MESYQRLIDVIALENLHMRVEYWILTKLLVASSLGQIAVTLTVLAIAYLAARPLRARLQTHLTHLDPARHTARGIAAGARSVAFPALALILLVLAMSIAGIMGWPDLLLATCVNLLAAWIVIRLPSYLIRSEFWSRVIAVFAFSVVTLNILGLLEESIVYLDQLGIRLGTIHLSVLDVLKGAVQLAALLWIALTASRLLEDRVQRAPGFTPSLRVLTAKLLRFTLVAIALTVALTSLGIDLTAFAVFTGALGVGIGFGMQKSMSNLISGLILLFDRSIKPGDVLELSDPADRSAQVFGWVTALNARYVSLTTRDGTEWLVPNEELISKRIVNWSYSHDRLRLLTPIAISFDSDVPLAMQITVEAARATPRVLRDPEPVCRLMSFADSTVNLELRFWIMDPTSGIINVRSEVLLAVWAKFREHGIRTPLGHRDLLIKKDSELTVTLSPRPKSAPV